jgi:hypothetical protein
VAIKTLFQLLESDYSPEEFLEGFPSATRGLACRALKRSEAAPRVPTPA